jgi:hypothetical protein
LIAVIVVVLSVHLLFLTLYLWIVRELHKSVGLDTLYIFLSWLYGAECIISFMKPNKLFGLTWVIMGLWPPVLFDLGRGSEHVHWTAHFFVTYTSVHFICRLINCEQFVWYSILRFSSLLYILMFFVHLFESHLLSSCLLCIFSLSISTY